MSDLFGNPEDGFSQATAQIGKFSRAADEKGHYSEPRHEKTRFLAIQKTKAQISCAANAQLISAFVFTTRIVQFLLLKPKISRFFLL